MSDSVPLLLPVVLPVRELDAVWDGVDVRGGVTVELLEAPTVRLEDPDAVLDGEVVALVELVPVPEPLKLPVGVGVLGLVIEAEEDAATEVDAWGLSDGGTDAEEVSVASLLALALPCADTEVVALPVDEPLAVVEAVATALSVLSDEEAEVLVAVGICEAADETVPLELPVPEYVEEAVPV